MPRHRAFVPVNAGTYEPEGAASTVHVRIAFDMISGGVRDCKLNRSEGVRFHPRYQTNNDNGVKTASDVDSQKDWF